MAITEVSVPKKYVLVQATEPTGAFEGQLWYNDNTDLTYIYQDGAWTLISIDVSKDVLQLSTENAQQQIEIIELQANASVTPFDNNTLISDTFSDATGYKDSVNVGNTDATFDVNLYKRLDGLGVSLISYYNFDETSGNLLDLVGSNDATNSNITYSQTGIIKNAYLYNQTPSYTIFDLNKEFPLNNFSISIWVKSNLLPNSGSGSTINPIILSLRRTGNNAFHIWNHITPAGNSNTIKVNYNGIDYDTTITAVNHTKYYHLVVIQKDSNLFVYVDNVLKINQTVTPITVDANYFIVGASTTSSALYKGNIDELGIWNKPITENQVSELYNTGSGLAYNETNYSLLIQDTKTVEIDLPTITGTVTHTQLIVNGTIETGASITYKLNNGTSDDTEEALNLQNNYNLTGAPTKLKILLNPKATTPTSGNPSINTYCLKIWKV